MTNRKALLFQHSAGDASAVMELFMHVDETLKRIDFLSDPRQLTYATEEEKKRYEKALKRFNKIKTKFLNSAWDLTNIRLDIMCRFRAEVEKGLQDDD